MLDAALDYVGKGWEIFPLVPGEKRPLTAHGFEDATTDTQQVRRWWNAAPKANIGFRLPTGVICLDIDPRNGGDPDVLGDIPATLVARTGGGGWHMLFRYRGNTAGKAQGAPGIDIKTRKGYLVAAPSIHPSGGRYEWQNHATIAPLPPHLYQMVQPPMPKVIARRAAPVSRGSAGLVRFVAEAPVGERNSRLFWAACRAAENRAPESEWADLAHAALHAGLAEPEIRATFASARRKEGARV